MYFISAQQIKKKKKQKEKKKQTKNQGDWVTTPYSWMRGQQIVFRYQWQKMVVNVCLPFVRYTRLKITEICQVFKLESFAYLLIFFCNWFWFPIEQYEKLITIASKLPQVKYLSALFKLRLKEFKTMSCCEAKASFRRKKARVRRKCGVFFDAFKKLTF